MPTNLGCAAFGSPQPAGARPTAETAARQAQLQLSAAIHLRQENWAAAVADLQSALALGPDADGQLHALLGRTHMQSGDLDASRQAFEGARAQGDLGLETCADLGSVYDMLGHYAQAADVYGACLRRWPQAHGLRHELGLSLLLDGRCAEAIPVLSALRAAMPSAPAPQLDLGQALVHCRRWSEAQALLTPLCRVPRPEADCRALAQADAALGELDAAHQLLTALLATQPQLTPAWALRARLYAAEGRFEQALPAYRTLSRLSPDDPAAHLGHALCLLALGQVAAAAEASATARSLGTTARSRFVDGLIAWRQGQPAGRAQALALATGALDSAEAWSHIERTALAVADSLSAQLARRHLTELRADPRH